MQRIVLVVATFFALACGCGAFPDTEALREAAEAAAGGEAGGAATPEADAVAKEGTGAAAGLQLDGRWCEENPEVGCYRFEGTVVHEEAVRMKRGTKHAATGTWSMEGNMLLMRFPNGTWTLEVLKHSQSILIVKDWSQDETFTFVRS